MLARGNDAAGDRAGYSVADLPPGIASRIEIDPASGDWLWTGRTDRDGYGRIGSEGAHRVVYRLLVGPIPPRRVLDHREDWGCRSKACCWPLHVKPVTNRQNVLRGRSFSAVNAAKTKCDNGHEYDLLNTYFRPSGHRDCRACGRDRAARYKRRLRRRDFARAA
jgi:hypothetical protein